MSFLDGPALWRKAEGWGGVLRECSGGWTGWAYRAGKTAAVSQFQKECLWKAEVNQVVRLAGEDTKKQMFLKHLLCDRH